MIASLRPGRGRSPIGPTQEKVSRAFWDAREKLYAPWASQRGRAPTRLRCARPMRAWK